MPASIPSATAHLFPPFDMIRDGRSGRAANQAGIP
jgi:hypothetical protein